ncbi:MAG TPA: hypothetical protein DCY02_09105 [Armatimonadetes bacterium]|nr:hypothetical protein [Armatimonadota bacterium]
MAGLVLETQDARIGLRANKTVAAVNARASERLGLPVDHLLGAPVERVLPASSPSEFVEWQPQSHTPSPAIRLNESTFQLVPATGMASEADQEPLFWFTLVPFVAETVSSTSPLMDLWTQALMAIETPAELFAMVKAGHRLMPGTAGLLAALDPSSQTLQTVAKWGTPEVAPAQPVPARGSWAMRLGRPVDSLELAEGFTQDHIVAAFDEATFCVPVVAGGRVWGVLSTRRNASMGLLPEDQRQLQVGLARRIGIVWDRVSRCPSE